MSNFKAFCETELGAICDAAIALLFALTGWLMLVAIAAMVA